MKRLRFSVLLTMFAFFCTATSSAAIIHVDDDAVADPGPNNALVSDPVEDGSTAHPFDSIQEAIDLAVTGDTVLVAPGTYFEIIDFAGKAITVESSDGRGVTFIDGDDLPGPVATFQNGEGLGSILRGFTLKSGTGGVVCLSASPTITECTITDCRVSEGGGIRCEDSSATISRNHIVGNSGTNYRGGAHLEDFYGLFTENVVAENTTHNNSGGLMARTSGGTISDNLILDNYAALYSGGMVISESTTVVTNNLIAGNESTRTGGGLILWSSPSAIVTNNTIAGNIAPDGGAGIRCSSDTPSISNCIVSGNDPDDIDVDGGGVLSTMTYSCAEGYIPGIGNIVADPLFAGGPGHSFYLSQIAAGQAADSPCVDAGDPASLVYGSTRTDQVADGHPIDMGYHAATDLEMSLGALPASLSCNLEYDGAAADLSLLIWSEGLGCVNWSVSESETWLSCSPASGTTCGEHDEVIVQVDPSGLATGTYSATLTITGTGVFGPPLEVPVTLTVTRALLGHAPESFYFSTTLGGAAPPAQTLDIRNDGLDTLDWTVSTYPDWLTLAPMAGSTTGEIDQVVVSVDTTGLPAGTHLANIQLVSPNAVPAAVTIPVSFYVQNNTIHVPADQPTIQAGIDAAVTGDLVLVADGTYTGTGNFNITFNGKSIHVESENGAPSCIVDCEAVGGRRGFLFDSGEGADSVVRGFTVRRGTAEGGGIACYSSSPTIAEMVIEDCTGVFEGGGIYCESSTVVIENCIVRNCFARDYGGGLCFFDSTPVIINTLITGNHADEWSSFYRMGGGLFSSDSTVRFVNCTIAGNVADYGIECNAQFSDLHFQNSILWNEGAETIRLVSNSTICSTYSDVFNPNSVPWPGPGNIHADPLFVSGPEGDHYLGQVVAGQAADSPCVDSGDPLSGMVQGTTRTDQIVDDGVVDMGYHYPQISQIYCTLTCEPGSGALPFQSQFTVFMENTSDQTRRVAARIDALLANGTGYTNWRAGWTNLTSAEFFSSSWNQNFPATGTLVGDNLFTMVAEDVTPAPYNQPPYLPSGDTDTGSCTVTGLAP